MSMADIRTKLFSVEYYVSGYRQFSSDDNFFLQWNFKWHIMNVLNVCIKHVF